MSTIVNLNQTFFDAIEAALKCKEDPNHPGKWLKKGTTTNEEIDQPKGKLVKIYVTKREEIKALTKEYNQAVGPIRDLLNKGGKLSEDEKDTAKEKFKEYQLEFESRLKALHGELYYEFEVALEEGFELREQFSILTQVKNAQQLQLDGLQKHAEIDQERLETPPDIDRRRNQMFSASMILDAVEENKAIGQYWRPLPFSILGADVGQPEVDRIAEFSPDALESNQAPGSSIKRWRLKKKGEAGAQPGKTDEEWVPVTTNYLEGRDELELKNLPSAGIYPWFWPEMMRPKTLPPLRIELNATVEENKEKGIPAGNGIVRCKIPPHASAGQKEVMLNVLAQIYMAKGWESVELGNRTDPELWKEAYLACRRAGFRHDQILFKGKPMNDQALELRGKLAREKLEEAYKSKEKEEKKGKPPEDPDEMKKAIEKLAGFTYCADLDKDTFFALENVQALELFEKGSLKQQAEILADYAFDTNSLSDYIETVTTPGELATLLDEMVEHNPDRLLAVFEAIGQKESDPTVQAKKQQDVFDTLHPETATRLLMQFPDEATRTKYFRALPEPNSPQEQNQKFRILASSRLSDAVMYELYSSLLDEQTKTKALDYLAAAPNNNQKALGAIIAWSFLAGEDQLEPAKARDMEMVVAKLTRVLDKQTGDTPDVIMSAVYQALPSDSRNDFGEIVRKFGKNNLYDVYKGVDEKQSGDNAKFSDTKIFEEKFNLIYGNTREEEKAVKFFYDSLTEAEVASTLRLSSPRERAAELEKLVEYAQDDKDFAKLARIALRLGPELVGKALAEKFDDLDNANNLLEAIQKEGENSRFLANVLSVYYNNVVNRGAGFQFDNLKVEQILPYVNHPDLIRDLARTLKHEALIDSINDASKTQQMKLFRQLPYAQQMDVMFDGNISLDRKSMLFTCWGKDEQKEYVEGVVDKRATVQDETLAANHLIACWQNSLLSGQDQHKEFNDLLIENNYKVFKFLIENSSKTNVPFLIQGFSDARSSNAIFNDVMKNLDQRFQGIQGADKQKIARENYLANVGQAIAALDKPKQTVLFVEELNNVNSAADVATVRAHALIDLMSKGDKETAKALFNDPGLISHPHLRAKDELQEKVVELAKEIPQPFQGNLYALVGHEEKTPAPDPGQGQNRLT